MSRHRLARWLALAAAFVMGSCQSFVDGFSNRYGPSPVLDAAAVSASADNQIRVTASFAKVSGLSPTSDANWYVVMEAGFNYVDERCDAYITELFRANREKDKLRGIAVLLDKGTGAILAASNASTQAITIVAQSFGIAEGATDLIATSYLYQIDPAHIQNLVRELRNAYRAQAFAKKDYFATPTAAYHGVQGYLELCLPQTIEARINEIVGRSKSFADPTAPRGPTVELLVGADPPLPRVDAAGAQNIPSMVTPPVPASTVSRSSAPIPARALGSASVPIATKRPSMASEVAEVSRQLAAARSEAGTLLARSPNPVPVDVRTRLGQLGILINALRTRLNQLTGRAEIAPPLPAIVPGMGPPLSSARPGTAFPPPVPGNSSKNPSVGAAAQIADVSQQLAAADKAIGILLATSPNPMPPDIRLQRDQLQSRILSLRSRLNLLKRRAGGG